jgi:hypothetical protein
MAINEKDIKILWGRAAGRCSHPKCLVELTSSLDNENYNIGEMAHIIGRRPTGPRGISCGGENTYDNLILLCPTHHTLVDKAPETYTIEILQRWKEQHEKRINDAYKTEKFDTFDGLRRFVTRILIANKEIINTFGPISDTAQRDPESNLFSVWELRRLDRIIPNNKKILNVIDSNIEIVPSDILSIVENFRSHAEAYEKHVYDRLDSYPIFPKQFEQEFLI